MAAEDTVVSESPWHDKDTLYHLYVEEEVSAAAIGERLGCTDVTVLDWLDRHDISTRNTDPPTMTGSDNPRSISIEDLITDYKRVAKELDKTPSQNEYNELGKYTWSAIQGHFDGMRDIQEVAGLEPLEKGRVTLECEVCGEEFSEKYAKKDSRRFCSPECDRKWRSEAFSGEGNPYDYNQIQFTCEWCGESYTRNAAQKGSTRFCSPECVIEWRSREFSGENHPRWKDNGEYYRGPNWERQREKARNRDGHECQHCGDSDSQLVVHHIKPYVEFDDYKEANRVQNLITLCQSCHSNVEWGNIDIQPQLGVFRE